MITIVLLLLGAQPLLSAFVGSTLLKALLMTAWLCVALSAVLPCRRCNVDLPPVLKGFATFSLRDLEDHLWATCFNEDSFVSFD